MLWQDDSGLFSLARTCPATALQVLGVCLVCLLTVLTALFLKDDASHTGKSFFRNSLKLYFPSFIRISQTFCLGPSGAFYTLFTLLYTFDLFIISFNSGSTFQTNLNIR